MYRWINDSLLGHLFHEDRKLFFWIGGFFLITVLCNLTKLQITPFFLWGMYSEKEQEPRNYPVIQVTVNNTNIIDYSAGFSDNTRFFLSSPLLYYKRTRENANEDPTLSFIRERSQPAARMVLRKFPGVLNDNPSLNEFGAWYGRYLQSLMSLKIHTITVQQVATHYDPSGRIVADSTHLFEEWHY